MPSNPHDYYDFNTTIPSLIIKAVDDPEALEKMLRHYVPAMRSYLMVRHHLDEHRAGDVVQDFILKKILEKKWLSEMNWEKGRFRPFLARSLDNFLTSQLRAENAQKRRPHRAASLEGLVVEPVDLDDPATLFDLSWARDAIERCSALMKEECARDGSNYWALIEARTKDPPATYEDLRRDYGFAKAGAVANALRTAKQRFLTLLRDLLEQQGYENNQLEETLTELKRILERSRPVQRGH